MCYSIHFYNIGTNKMDVDVADAKGGKLFYVVWFIIFC